MITINVYSHGICLTPENQTERSAIMGYVRNLIQSDTRWDPKTKSQVSEKKAIFASTNAERSEFRMMRKDLEPFLEHLDFVGLGRQHVSLVDTTCTTYDDVGLKLKRGITARDEQQEAALTFGKDDSTGNRVLHAATGFGKTVCGYMLAAHYGRRTAFIMEPTHITTWVRSAGPFLDITNKDILTIQGSAQLDALIDLRECGMLEGKMIFFSAPTLRNYIKDCEDPLLRGKWRIQPSELFPYLGIGLCIRDEAHESIHALCKQVMYMNVPLCIFLSATLVSDNAFINNIYKKVFPMEDRWESKPNQHICVRSVRYSVSAQERVKAVGPMGYSHVTYEKSLMKKAKLKKAYWELIKDCIEKSFLTNYKEGTKCLVICATKKMCSYLKEMAQKAWDDKTIGCFIGGAKDAELYERDIVFSTPKGAGTGKDIPNLSVAYNTVAIGSTQLSRQVMGRLRPIKLYPDQDPYYYLLFNREIRQHLQYEQKRKIDSLGRCKDFKTIELDVCLTSK